MISIPTLALPVLFGLLPPSPPGAPAGPTPGAFWGREGHMMAGRAAAERLPREMPRFFLAATPRLAWLSYEPDRWRSGDLRAMGEAFRYDHYLDMENVPAGALDAPDRFRYLEAVYASELESPVRDTGLLPYRILEVQERLTTGFARWRTATDPARRRWIEERILNDAGVLGHYVEDAAQPHHTTIHFNGWAEGVANPEGYTRSDDIHQRFESAFVRAHVGYDDVASRVRPTARVVDDLWAAIMAHLVESHGQVERLYRLERDVGFDPDGAPSPRARDFAAERLAAGATMLRDLWWTAWVRSEALTDG